MYLKKDAILCIGFYCQIYKKNPNIRIFLNNRFIDEIDIQSMNSIDNKLPNLYFYHLKLHPFPVNHKIHLEVTNSDSNYNNGFMTKSTLLRFYNFSLLPHSDCELAYNIIKEDPDVDHYNLLPYTVWQGNNGNILDNIINSTIGGSGTFLCNFSRNIGSWIFEKPSIS